MGNKKIKPPHLEVVSMGIFGGESHGFLSFSPQIKKFFLIEKKFLFKNPLFATKNAVFRRIVNFFSFSSKIFVFFFEISLYLYIRNSN